MLLAGNSPLRDVKPPGHFRISVMQPYFVPYLGYFRLFARSDLVVLYDCVQFLRRGYQHRNRLVNREGAADWLTLPISRCPRDTKLCDLRFRAEAETVFRASMRRFPALDRLQDGHLRELAELLTCFHNSPVGYIGSMLEFFCARLGLRYNVLRSSTLDLPEDLRGQDRVLEICLRLGATHYLNVPGGVGLYDSAKFQANGLGLEFLEPWTGSYWSVLQLHLEDALPDRLV